MKEGAEFKRDIDDVVISLNSAFRDADVDIKVVEITFAKEQIVIGIPQIESLEKELSDVKHEEEFGLGRYLATVTVRRAGREIPYIVRFYLTSDKKLSIEYSIDNGATLVDMEEADKPELRERVVKTIKETLPWVVLVVRVILSTFGYTPGNPLKGA